jgi:tape measure domain-containing protein
MSTISSSLRLQGNFLRVMQSNLTATHSVISAMEQANAAANTTHIDKTFAAAQKQIDLAGREVEQFQEELNDAGRQVNNVDSSARRTATGFNLWGRAIVVANQGLQLAQQLWSRVEQSMTNTDALQSVNARLGLINDGLRTQQQLQNAVRQAANETRSEYNITADLVAKVARTQIFKSNDGAIKFAKQLNKVFIASGASAAEQQSAMLQLSQALSSGRLQGDELRSLSETAPMLMNYLADGLGVARGQLKQMGADGELTSAKIATAIMKMSDQIDADFAKMPVTFGQVTNLIGNKIGALRERLLQPGQAFDRIIQKASQVYDYLNTPQGMVMLDNMAIMINGIVDGLMKVTQAAADTYQYFSSNWTTLEPILAGIATAVGFITAAYLIYKGVATAIAAVEAIKGAATMLATGATIGATAAQWGLNAALFACPLTWIILAVVAVIAALVAFGMYIYKLWQTNIDFRAAIIRIWNSILHFIDLVGIGFTNVGYGIANAFDTAKANVLTIVESMVNGVISAINWLIEQLNKIPGVSIAAIEQVGFGAAAQAQAEANKQARDQQIADMVNEANQKAADREAKLQEDYKQWQADAAAKAAADQVQAGTDTGQGGGDTSVNDNGGGGGGGGGGAAKKQIDLAEQQLKYLKDIAEQETLSTFAALAASMDALGEVRLSREDAELLRQSAGQSNVFYLNYQGGNISAAANITQGATLEEMQAVLEEQAQEEIDTGVAGLYELIP